MVKRTRSPSVGRSRSSWLGPTGCEPSPLAISSADPPPVKSVTDKKGAVPTAPFFLKPPPPHLALRVAGSLELAHVDPLPAQAARGHVQALDRGSLGRGSVPGGAGTRLNMDVGVEPRDPLVLRLAQLLENGHRFAVGDVKLSGSGIVLF